MSIAVKMVLKSRDKKRVVWNAGNGGGMQCVGCGSVHILRPHPYPDLSLSTSQVASEGTQIGICKIQLLKQERSTPMELNEIQHPVVV